ncbi:MAG: peptidase M12 [Aquimarina sp.]|nr:peptidase M12 [Aquimarina sp.]
MKNVFLNFKLFMLAGLISLSSCTEEDLSENTNEMTNQSNLTEKYFLGDKVIVKLENDGTYSLYGNSDIRLFPDQLSDSPLAFDKNPEPGEINQKLAQGGYVRKWTNNTVVYVLDSSLSANVISELQRSFDEWESKTSIRFKERTNESNYVTISSNGQSCNCGVATLGMNGDRGYIRLGSGSTAVVIIHELGHTLGYLHEQNRPDRDDYIIVNYDNVQDGYASQFDISSNAILLTEEFDIGSTMMYGSYTFSKNGQPTITDLSGNVLPRRAARISEGDIAGTNQAYPGDGGDGNPPTDPCEGVLPWSPYTSYSVGDRVTYYGNLYERDYTGWIFVTSCP